MKKFEDFFSNGMRNNGCLPSVEYCDYIFIISVDVKGSVVLGITGAFRAQLLASPFGRSMESAMRARAIRGVNSGGI